MLFWRKQTTLNKIKNKDKFLRFVIYLFCAFGLGLLYNLFFVPYNLVIGGIGGLAIIVKDFTGIDTSLFNNVATVVLLIISFIIIGKKKTLDSLVGAIIYTSMITITAPISKFITIQIDSYLFMTLIVGILYGILYGITYRVGYSTGGVDIIMNIILHFKKIPMGSLCNYVNVGIVILGVLNLGIAKVIYGLLCMFLGNFVTDFVLLGNRDSKMCLIKTNEYKNVEKLLEKNYKVGYTVLKSSGGVDKHKKTTLFCIIPSEYYYDFCHRLLKIDKSAFLSSTNCHEVSGGYRKTWFSF